MILGIAAVLVLAVIATPQVFAGADNTGFPSWGGPSDIIPPEDGFVSSAAVDVDTNQGNNEPEIAVNPLNPNQIAISSAAFATTQISLSQDGGATWPITVLAAIPPGLAGQNYVSVGDPVLAYDSQGQLFWTYLLSNNADVTIVVVEVNPTTGALGVAVDVSPGNFPGGDKQWLVADSNPGSPFADNLYIVWVRFVPISGIDPVGLEERVLFSRSTDSNISWSPPQAVSLASEWFAWPPHVAVAPNGDVYVNYPTTSCAGNGLGSTVQLLRDTTGGADLAAGNAVQKSTVFAAGDADITCNVQTFSPIPGSQSWMQGSQASYTLADPLVPGKIYVVSNDDPNDDFTTGDSSDIVMATSLDFGVTFPTITTISDDQTGAFQVMPTGAIDEFGNIAVTWYDSRNAVPNAAGNFLLDLFGSTSTDGGVTFADNFQVSDAAFDPDLNAPTRFNGPPPTLRIGEYNGIDALNCLAYTVWTGNDATSNLQEIFFDTFAIPGECIGDIHGFKYEDIDADGIFNNGDVPIEDWEICQFIPGQEPNPDDAEDCQDTNDEGEVWFEELESGDYIACEEVQDGWTNTTDECVNVSIDANNQEAIVEFGNLLVITSSKSWTLTDYNWDPICDGVVITDTCFDNADDLNVIGFRPANTETDDVLAEELLTDDDGKFLVNGNVHPKNDKFQNTNPGAFYAVTTIEVQTDIDGLWVTELYEDCTDNDGILKLLAPNAKPERAVKVAVADSNDDVTELTDDLYDGVGGSIAADNIQAEIHIEQSIEAGSTVYVLVKFQHNLKGEVFPGGLVDVMCHNEESVTASIDGLPDASVDVDADLRITNQE